MHDHMYMHLIWLFKHGLIDEYDEHALMVL